MAIGQGEEKEEGREGRRLSRRDLNPASAAEAVKSGLAFVCALCHNHWRALDAGAPTCGRIDCCGPPFGGVFPDYDGPINDFERQCFVCGNPNIIGNYKVTGENRRFGVCGRHDKSIAKEGLPHLLLLTR